MKYYLHLYITQYFKLVRIFLILRTAYRMMKNTSFRKDVVSELIYLVINESIRDDSQAYSSLLTIENSEQNADFQRQDGIDGYR